MAAKPQNKHRAAERTIHLPCGVVRTGAANLPTGIRIDGHVVLARRFENPRFRRIETFSPRNHLHAFRFERPEEVDAEGSSWLAEAYQVGEQRHLL